MRRVSNRLSRVHRGFSRRRSRTCLSDRGRGTFSGGTVATKTGTGGSRIRTRAGRGLGGVIGL